MARKMISMKAGNGFAKFIGSVLFLAAMALVLRHPVDSAEWLRGAFFSVRTFVQHV